MPAFWISYQFIFWDRGRFCGLLFVSAFSEPRKASINAAWKACFPRLCSLLPGRKIIHCRKEFHFFCRGLTVLLSTDGKKSVFPSVILSVFIHASKRIWIRSVVSLLPVWTHEFLRESHFPGVNPDSMEKTLYKKIPANPWFSRAYGDSIYQYWILWFYEIMRYESDTHITVNYSNRS